MTQMITSAEYTAAFDNDLSEVCELFLRHARIYIETIAISSNTESYYVSCVSQTLDDDIGRIACNGIDSKHLKLFGHYRHETICEVNDFYALYMKQSQTHEISV